MNLPGNEFHQKILEILLDVFQKDNNVSVFGIFGSISRGNWDKYSDLDLDVIVKDRSKQIIDSEFKAILSVLDLNGLIVLLYFEEFKNEWVIIFDTLDRISIRFHLVKETIPHILESFIILYGNLTAEDIKAPIVEQKPISGNIESLKNKFIEISIYVPIALHRNQLINAEFFINKMRNIFIEIYVRSRKIPRLFDFEKIAEQELKEKIYSSYPRLEASSIKKSHEILVSVFSSSIKSISNNKLNLSENEFLILRKSLKY